jgi:hypothetical protein
MFPLLLLSAHRAKPRTGALRQLLPRHHWLRLAPPLGNHWEAPIPSWIRTRSWWFGMVQRVLLCIHWFLLKGAKFQLLSTILHSSHNGNLQLDHVQDSDMVFDDLTYTQMAPSTMVCLPPLVNHQIYQKHFRIVIGKSLWTLSVILWQKIKLGTLFLLRKVAMLLIVSGYIKLKEKQMAAWIDIKPV